MADISSLFGRGRVQQLSPLAIQIFSINAFLNFLLYMTPLCFLTDALEKKLT